MRSCGRYTQVPAGWFEGREVIAWHRSYRVEV